MNDVPTQVDLDRPIVSSFIYNDLGFRKASYLALRNIACITQLLATSWSAASLFPFEHPLRKSSTWMLQVFNLCDLRPICACERVKVIE